LKYQFSFTDKHELIFINEQPYKKSIGELIKCVIDTDWDEMKNKFSSVRDMKMIISQFNLHPVIKDFVFDSEENEIYKQLEQLSLARNVYCAILELMIDEPKDLYEERFLEIILSENIKEFKSFFFRIEPAWLMPVYKRNKNLYGKLNPFAYLFETNDLMTILTQEFQFICSNDFYIRKCARCRNYFWTKKTNKIYCPRIVSDSEKTCMQIGPMKKWLEKRTDTYAHYWKERTKMFQRRSSADGEQKYSNWLEATDKYKELAKQNKISKSELAEILKQIEKDIYQSEIKTS